MRAQMTEVAQLLHALAWPLVTLVLIWRFGDEFKKLIVKLGDRLDQAATIKLKLAGLGALELAGLVAKRSIVPIPGGAPAMAVTAGRAGETQQQEFDRLIVAYEAVNDPDRSQRVAKRDALAYQLGELGRRMQIARSTLAEGSDAKIAVLATMVTADPKRGDLPHLATASTRVAYKFSAYRLVLALLSFLSSFPPSPRSLHKAVDILDEIEKRLKPDEDLAAIIDRARRAIEASVG